MANCPAKAQALWNNDYNYDKILEDNNNNNNSNNHNNNNDNNKKYKLVTTLKCNDCYIRAVIKIIKIMMITVKLIEVSHLYLYAAQPQ